MSNWDLYELMLRNGSLTDEVRDLAAKEAVSHFLCGVEDDPAYQPSARINNRVAPIVASRKSTVECSIKASPSTDISLGDVVECLGEHWLVMELYKDKIGLINGTMWICNHILHFQNHTPDIYTRYCVVDDGSYAKKSTDPDAYVMANTYRVYLGIDEQTQKLFVDKRLSFGTTYSSDGNKKLEVYKIVGMDLTSRNHGVGSHMMMMLAQRDVYNPETDSIVTQICDVVKNSPQSSTTPSIGGSCEITGKDTIRIGTARSYNVIFTDANGGAVTEITPEWQITAPDGVTYRIENNTCKISTPLDPALVGAIIEITASDLDGNYGECTKKVEVITVG